jgi:sugar lactone lactonase YvrE
MTHPLPPGQRAVPRRPQLEILEDRLAPGDLFSGLLGCPWAGKEPDLADLLAPAAVARPNSLAEDLATASPPVAGAVAAPLPLYLPGHHTQPPSASRAALPDGNDPVADPLVPGPTGRSEPLQDGPAESTSVLLADSAAGYDHSHALAEQLYLSDFGDGSIQRANPDGHVQPFVEGGLSGPVEIAFDRHNNLYVATTFSNSITRVTPGGQVSTFASVTGPLGLAFDSSGVLYTASPLTSSISKIASDGTVTPFVTAGLDAPLGLAVDRHDNLYVSNFFVGSVSKITPDGTVSTFASGFTQPLGLAFDAQDNLYVANGPSTISKVAPDGTVSTFVSAGLSKPAGITFDRHGTLYVANEDGGSVSQVSPQGVVTTFVTGLLRPQDVAFRHGQ